MLIQTKTQSTDTDTNTDSNVIPFRRPECQIRQAANSTTNHILNTLELGHVEMHYQPQVALATGNIHGIEALIRAQDRAGSPLNPAILIASAEALELIDGLGQHILKIACADYAKLRAAGTNVGGLAINVSPLELRQPDYASQTAQIIADAGLNYADVELEITESWSLSDPSLNLSELVTLAELGVRLAIDDFGVAHTAWSHVLDLPVSTLKIDRSIINKITDSKRAAIVTENICRTCEQLDMQVVAEGVCTTQQRQMLRDMGCTYGQGFGLGRPVTALRVEQQKVGVC